MGVLNRRSMGSLKSPVPLTHHGVHLLEVVAVPAMLAGAHELGGRGERYVYVQKGEHEEEGSFAVPEDTAVTGLMSLLGP